MKLFKFKAILKTGMALASAIILSHPQARSHAAAPPKTADRIYVDKSDRTLKLFRKGKLLKTYFISLGDDPLGHKVREGDEKTPEGIYQIDWNNPGSAFHLSLHISYPNERDKARAEKMGVDPGGMIMIHGLPNGMDAPGPLQNRMDWTDGCMAVSNEEMEEIWRLVPVGTTIEIRP